MCKQIVERKIVKLKAYESIPIRIDGSMVDHA
jgi:hypothetical protein